MDSSCTIGRCGNHSTGLGYVRPELGLQRVEQVFCPSKHLPLANHGFAIRYMTQSSVLCRYFCPTLSYGFIGFEYTHILQSFSSSRCLLIASDRLRENRLEFCVSHATRMPILESDDQRDVRDLRTWIADNFTVELVAGRQGSISFQANVIEYRYITPQSATNTSRILQK
jgi:hypothetical protein